MNRRTGGKKDREVGVQRRIVTPRDFAWVCGVG